MSETLNETDRRVLGVLMEKALTHPQYYPMSINAIVTGCNQKSNREPVMSLDEDTVWDALERLREAGLVTRLMPGGSSRVDRYRHEVQDRLGWEKPQRAVMAELLLRGPQTAGELRTRCARMFPFENTDVVQSVLEILREHDPVRVTPLPRAPGQAATRYAHQLYPPEEWSRIHAAAESNTSSAAVVAPAAAPVGGCPTAQIESPNVEVAALRTEIENMQSEIADLHEEIATLRRRLDALGG